MRAASPKLLLRSVKIEESLVTDYVDKAMEIFKHNTVGPQKSVLFHTR